MPGITIVAIHQPNFFPWLGYFDKIAKCHQFIIMDNVQLPKKGGTWANRVKMLLNGEAVWVTIPIMRNYHGVLQIRDVQINNATPWREKLIKTLQINYKRAPYFDEVFPFLRTLADNPVNMVAEYNCFAIRCLAEALRLDPSKLILGSILPVEGKATDLLISLVKAVGGTAYLCGGGSAGYLEEDKFTKAGIDLIYQNFQHPIYPQFNTREFIPGLSVLDGLMNCGFEGTRKLILSGQV